MGGSMYFAKFYMVASFFLTCPGRDDLPLSKKPNPFLSRRPRPQKNKPKGCKKKR